MGRAIKASLLPKSLYYVRFFDLLCGSMHLVLLIILTIPNIFLLSLSCFYLLVPMILHIYGIITGFFCLYKLHTIYSLLLFLEGLSFLVVAILDLIFIIVDAGRGGSPQNDNVFMFNAFLRPPNLYEQLFLIFTAFIFLLLSTLLNLFLASWFSYGMRIYFHEFDMILPNVTLKRKYISTPSINVEDGLLITQDPKEVPYGL